MNAVSGTLPLIFEAAIAAQMILFAGVQAAGIARLASLRSVLALATGSLGAAAAINMLTAVGVWSGLRDANLVFELACAVSIYLYVAHAFEGAPALTTRDLWHLGPPAFVFLAWEAGLVANVDAIMLAILAVYVAAAFAALLVHWRHYRPALVLRFAVLLAVSVGALVLLRSAVMYEASLGVGLRDSIAYLMLLLFTACVSSAVLLTELRRPGLLSEPWKHIKYQAAGTLSEDSLDALDKSFRGTMAREKPFLKPELSLEALADAMGVGRRDLSQLANARYRMTFPALMNEWRLDEAARLLADPSNQSPITTIMYDAGFGSKSSFQREFQKKFGMSPSAYRESTKKQQER